MKTIFNLICYIIILIIEFSAVFSEDCGTVTNCPNKRYPYTMCSDNNNGMWLYLCTENPRDPNLHPPYTPYTVFLPICVDIQMMSIPSEIKMPNRTGGEIKVFDINYAIDELNKAAFLWNCLCGKEKDNCQCEILV
jgi:hypothetical protein